MNGEMLSEDICEFLLNLGLCEICVRRYVNKYDFNSVKDLENDDLKIKKTKPNICVACLGIFQDIDSVAQVVLNDSNLQSFDCNSIYSSISIPITLLIRDLSIWITLIEKFPGKIDDITPPNISIKDAFKVLFNKKLCDATNRTLENNQNGILINLFFDFEQEHEEIERILNVKPFSLNSDSRNRKNGKNAGTMTRNLFEKHYFPTNLNFDECRKYLQIPPQATSICVKLARFTVNGPTIFIAGRYRKLSRDLSQTPWVLNGKRMKESSIQELISHEICPYFGINMDLQNEKLIFMGSGREDIDVRCLGSGRPFAFQISDAKKTKLPRHEATEMALRTEKTKEISVEHLQLINRGDLVHIKEGEEQKKKLYRALCILKIPVSIEIINKLNIPNGFLVHQKTPLRVLHRRPLLTRPRQVFSVEAYTCKEHHKLIVIDIITQAGAYIKELIHGEFQRTTPSISSIIGQQIDIIALDVNGIDLDWPPSYL